GGGDPRSRAALVARRLGARAAGAVVGADGERRADGGEPRGARAHSPGARVGDAQRTAIRSDVLRRPGPPRVAAGRAPAVGRWRNRGGVSVRLRRGFRRARRVDAALVAILFRYPPHDSRRLSDGALTRYAGRAGALHHRLDAQAETRGGTEAMSTTRVERDPLGELPVPSAALYGVQTERA